MTFQLDQRLDLVYDDVLKQVVPISRWLSLYAHKHTHTFAFQDQPIRITPASHEVDLHSAHQVQQSTAVDFCSKPSTLLQGFA